MTAENWRQYALPPSFVMWSRTWRACPSRPLRRSASSVVFERLEVRRERNLRIDDDRLSTRNPHDEVGPEEVPDAVARGRLDHEVAVLEHARALDDVPQLRFAPSAADVRGTERVGERPVRSLSKATCWRSAPYDCSRARSRSWTVVPTRCNDSFSGATVVSSWVPSGIEETGPRLLESLCRGGADRIGQAPVEPGFGGVDTPGHPGELPLELDHANRGLCGGPAPLEERRTQQQEGAEGARDEPNQQRCDRHEGKGG